MVHPRGSWLLVLLLTLSVAGDAWLGRPAPGPVAIRATPASRPPQAKPTTPGDLLARRRLAIPVQGIRPTQLQDTFTAARSRGRNHKAIDIMAPWGTPVLAADDGRLEKMSRNAGGGIAVYQSDPTG
jgi:murein DD-endopeptidase MepM/ murein hydrolase activator NlpD